MFKVKKYKTLLVGANGSLGSFLLEHIEVDKFGRDSNLSDFIGKSYDVIIYCASNTSNLNNNQLGNYFYDNYELLCEILKINHQYLIYFSTVDIYPKNMEHCLESMEIPIRDLASPYSVFKLLSEELIKKVEGGHFAILRPSMMISSNSPKNNLRQLVECQLPKLSVTKESEYNAISYFDVLNAVKYFMDSRQSGVYNLASSKNIKLADLAEKLNKEVEWGKFTYALNNIDNTKISKIITAFSRTSEQIIYELFKRS